MNPARIILVITQLNDKAEVIICKLDGYGVKRMIRY